MGVAGVAMMYSFISFCKLIGALSKWFSWKSSGVLCPAVVVELKSKKENYKNKKNVTQYQYTVAVDYQGKQPTSIYPLALFEEIVHADEVSDVSVGKEMKLLYDPKKSICVDGDQLKSAVKTNLLMLIVSIAIFWGCFLILQLIN